MIRQSLSVLALPFSLSIFTGCASSTPGAQPHDMSAAHHEAMAASETTAASVHGGQYEPGATVRTERCASRTGGYDGGCWTSVSNPTSEHVDEARKHQKMAADHRAASQALRDAETQACVGLSEPDRDMSPFEHCEDIASVDPLNTVSASGKASSSKMIGATVVFRALPGMTAPWLQRVIDCHVARNAALGHDVPEMPYCPLVPKNVSAHVAETNAGLAVAVRSDDSDSAREVLRRAQALVTACPRVTRPAAPPHN
jgi:hypothetical protein